MDPHFQTLKHVAIIMDGNGRWAKERRRPRIWGHVRGSSIVSDIVQAADDWGIKCLSFYAFSTENWSRPKMEITILLKLLEKFLEREEQRILKNRICFRVLGDLTGVPLSLIQKIKTLEMKTQNAPGLNLSFCFGYGGRQEILYAVNQHLKTHPHQPLSMEHLSSHLYYPNCPDVDLVIRTGGEKRISNFLLWQSAYAELAFTETKWPDFNRQELYSILLEVEKRERRFGKIEKGISMESSLCEAIGNIKNFENSITEI